MGIEYTSLVTVIRLGIAGLVGLAVGTEREWSRHGSPARRRFAGIRTFLLLGLLGGMAGLLSDGGHAVAGGVLLASGAAFTVVAYWMATRGPARSLDGTTEAAALVVLGLAFLAGLGSLALAGGSVVVVVFVLAEKQGLHRFAANIDRAEMRATLQFAALAAVILPLLPTGPYPGLLGLRPRALWAVVVLFSGLNYGGYLARRIIGVDRGYGVAGVLGGILSSTAVTLQFSRVSRGEPAHARALALGVIGACTVLPIRVVVLSIVLNPRVALALVPYMLPTILVGVVLLGLGWRRALFKPTKLPEVGNPLRLISAIKMAALFELAMITIAYAQQVWGSTGALGSAVVLGLIDADALTVSMTRMPGGLAMVPLAARGIAGGILASVVFKFVLAGALGGAAYRRWVLPGIGIMAVSLAASLVLAGAI